MACHRSAELVGDGSWRRRQNVNRLLKLLLKTKGSHVYRCNIEVDVTRYLQTVTAKSKSNFWREEYSWALDHSKSHAEPGTSSFSHIIPSPVPHPCHSPSTGRRGGGVFAGDAVAAWGRVHPRSQSCLWATPCASQEMGQGHPWTSQEQWMLCWTSIFLLFWSLYQPEGSLPEITCFLSLFSFPLDAPYFPRKVMRGIAPLSKVGWCCP